MLTFRNGKESTVKNQELSMDFSPKGKLTLNLKYFKNDILGLISCSELQTLLIPFSLRAFPRLALLWKAQGLYSSVRMEEKLLVKNMGNSFYLITMQIRRVTTLMIIIN